MKKPQLTLCLALAGLVSGGAFASGDPAAPRIFDCGTQVQSHKRGVCENKMAAADFTAFAPGVSWYYNWHYRTDDVPPAGVAMDFIPMGWGNRPEALAGVDTYLGSVAKKPRCIFAINEPNLKGQAFIDPKTTAELYRKIEAIGAKYNVPVVGPHMALGSPTDSSITAFDPIDNKQETYTFMIPFLKAFFFYLQKTETPGVSLHTYGALGEMKWAVKTMYDTFHLPVWVTEYAEWNAADDDAERDYLMQATDFLERSSYVQGYAWFKERADNGKISLLAPEPGKLTALGQAYVNMPVHDTDVYYRVPGQILAQNYTEFNDMDIMVTKKSAMLVTSTANNATVGYNIQVDQAGSYQVGVRGLFAGAIDIMEGDKVLATVKSQGDEVETQSASVDLPAGAQTVRLRLNAPGQVISSLKITR